MKHALAAGTLASVAMTLSLAAQQPVGQPQDVGADFSPKPPVRALSPQEEARHFVLPPGYHLELVLAERDVINPFTLACVVSVC